MEIERNKLLCFVFQKHLALVCPHGEDWFSPRNTAAAFSSCSMERSPIFSHASKGSLQQIMVREAYSRGGRTSPLITLIVAALITAAKLKPRRCAYPWSRRHFPGGTRPLARIHRCSCTAPFFSFPWRKSGQGTQGLQRSPCNHRRRQQAGSCRGSRRRGRRGHA